MYTVDAARRWAQAVAVREGRIAAVGTDDDIRPLIGPRTQVVNLDGRMLLPGFQDAHIHAPSGGLDRLRIDLSEVHSLDEYRERVRAYAEGRPEVTWVLGGGWAMDVFPGGTPGREELDALVPDRPAFISNRDNHGAWVNSRALELAGVTAATPDPHDGRIERDERGVPSGTMHEGAMDLVRRHIPPTGAEERMRGLLAAQAHLHSLGITAWQDAIVGAYPTIEDNYDVYVDASERGWLTATVIGALWYARGRSGDQIPFLMERREATRNGRFRATSVKIMADGVCEIFTAAMLDPFLGPDGRATENTGISFFEPDELREAVVRLDAEGFQVHVHVIGDRACRTALDAVEAARSRNGPNDLRHHLAHLQVIHPDDVPRFRELGVTANGQPLWAAHEPQMDELTIPYLGEPRASWQYPFGSLVRSGATLAFGSDWPVSSPNPLWEIHVAVNRVAPEEYPYAEASHGTRPFLPDQRLDLPTALAAFTIGSAYVNHLDGETGSIEPGKLADLVVLDRNLFEHPVDEIAQARVLLTLVEGKTVFETSEL